jgi:CHAD domain-containing protein
VGGLDPAYADSGGPESPQGFGRGFGRGFGEGGAGFKDRREPGDFGLAEAGVNEGDEGDEGDEGFPEATAGMVLHRVLAGAARTFLLNDMGDELVDDNKRCETVDALSVLLRPRPLWAHSAVEKLDAGQRRTTEAERIHQSRVALRRIRSNLRTFRLLLDPAWGTTLRAELAWYGNRLGELRDLHIIDDMVATTGSELLGTGDVERLRAAVAVREKSTMAAIAAERGGARRFNLTEQMMVLWDGPAFKPKASRPAGEVLPAMLHRAWHDLRGASRRARQDPTPEHLHKVRIRVKDLRYGCNTVALVEGGPARKTAKAAESLQVKLGDFHDALYSVDWLVSLAAERPDLAGPVDVLVTAQLEAAKTARKGWKRSLKEVERSWRSWRG